MKYRKMSKSSSKFGLLWISISWMDIKENSMIFQHLKNKYSLRIETKQALVCQLEHEVLFDDSYWLEFDWIKINLHIKSDKNSEPYLWYFIETINNTEYIFTVIHIIICDSTGKLFGLSHTRFVHLFLLWENFKAQPHIKWCVTNSDIINALHRKTRKYTEAPQNIFYLFFFSLRFQFSIFIQFFIFMGGISVFVTRRHSV